MDSDVTTEGGPRFPLTELLQGLLRDLSVVSVGEGGAACACSSCRCLIVCVFVAAWGVVVFVTPVLLGVLVVVLLLVVVGVVVVLDWALALVAWSCFAPCVFSWWRCFLYPCDSVSDRGVRGLGGSVALCVFALPPR